MHSIAFFGFKYTVYALLLLNMVLFLRTEETVTGFVDSAAWLLLLGVMEYESTSLDQDYTGPWEKRIVTAINVFAYAMISYAFVGYIIEQRWIDVVNAGAWLGVVAVLFYQMYWPGDYDGPEYRIVNGLKIGLYAALVGCALWWTLEADGWLDPIDAWLWLICFAVIEVNVFGFEHEHADEIGLEADAARGPEVGPRAEP